MAASTRLTVYTQQFRGAVPTGQAGVNHAFGNNGHGVWDPVRDEPVPIVVDRLRAAGVNRLRYPGGTTANLFDWKDSIGPARSCQTNGAVTPDGFRRAIGESFGVDEGMELATAVGAESVIMVPFIAETPADAADWVEYLNSPADGSNPNGGIDWAERRAQYGHPAPYGVRYWEVGNEQRLKQQRYWMSQDTAVAVRQYANGAAVPITGEMLGSDCAHPTGGAASTGRPGQVFQLLYPPAMPDSAHVEFIGSGPWTQVPDLSRAGPRDRVFELDAHRGELTFGNGVHGAVLPQGVRIRASYVSVHEGVFAFLRAMEDVDPSIHSCVTWGRKEFIRVAGRRTYDCFSVHSYAHFGTKLSSHWASAQQGHDQHMVAARTEADVVERIKADLPPGTSLVITEFGALFGDETTYPQWVASLTRATFMASLWVSWLHLRIPLTLGNDLASEGARGMLGPAPYFTTSAEALARRAMRPLYQPGSSLVRTRLTGNPVRHPTDVTGTYPALVAAATRTPRGALRLLVVNRLPRGRVRTQLDLRGFAGRGVAVVSTVTGASFRAWNTPERTDVRLTTYRRTIRGDGFLHVFPAHSVTVLRIPPARR